FRPPRYHRQPVDGALEIPESIRVPHPYFKSLAELSGETRSKLEASIESWLHQNNIDKSQVTRRDARRADNRSGGSALQRLLAAQPRETLHKLVIPGDIIELLLKSP